MSYWRHNRCPVRNCRYRPLVLKNNVNWSILMENFLPTVSELPERGGEAKIFTFLNQKILNCIFDYCSNKCILSILCSCKLLKHSVFKSEKVRHRRRDIFGLISRDESKRRKELKKKKIKIANAKKSHGKKDEFARGTLFKYLSLFLLNKNINVYQLGGPGGQR